MSTYSFCTVARLETCFTGDPLGARANDDDVLAATREALELARRAYRESSARDEAIAERLLYLIHKNNAFAPPVIALPAVIGNALIRAKLESLLPAGPPDELSQEEMVAALESAVLRDGTHRHLLLDDLARDTTLRGYQVFLKNWYAMASGLTEFLFSVAQRATPAMRGEIQDNLSDEIFGDTPHIDLRARVLAGAGTRFDEKTAVEDADIATETFGLINWRAAASSLSNPGLALGLFYSIEANWQHEAKRHYAALKPRVSEEYLTSLALHVERDEDHANDWMGMLKKAVTLPRDRGWVVRGLFAEFTVRRKMYDAIRRSLYDR